MSLFVMSCKKEEPFTTNCYCGEITAIQMTSGWDYYSIKNNCDGSTNQEEVYPNEGYIGQTDIKIVDRRVYPCN